MKYRSRRGRPKMQHEKRDQGTPELRAKRKTGMTSEPLDICLKRGIFTENEHWAGVHLRWLYTVCLGSPGISALDMSYIGGRNLQEYDESWLKSREEEYAQAIALLRKMLCKSLVMNLCVFNHHPRFLYRYSDLEGKPCPIKGRSSSYSKALQSSAECKKYKEALSELFDLFTHRIG